LIALLHLHQAIMLTINLNRFIMKKLIIFLSLGIFFFTSCSKEESNDQFTEQTADSVYVLNHSNGTTTWEAISTDKLETNVTSNNRGNSSHTHGNIAGFSTFNGTQNNGGSHGSAVIHIPNQLHIILETTSVAVIGADGNEAIYGGLVTEVVFNNIPPPPPPPCPTFPNCPPPPPPPPCSPFDLGSYVYFSVIDNGQGNNADPDEYRPVLFPSCNASPDGFASFPWFIFGSIVLDQNGADNVKVNN